MSAIHIDSHACKGCGLCVSVCPKKILELNTNDLNEKGYAPAAMTDASQCILCGFCTTICPDVAITMLPEKGE